MKAIMNYKWVWGMAVAAALVLGYMFWAGKAQAADLGGNCCADLEERIAELEATVAKKGNRKVSLRVYGVVSKAIIYTSIEDYENWAVGVDNSNKSSYVGFRGEAKINPKTKAGYVAEIGLGGYDVEAQLGGLGYGPLNGTTDEIYVRRSFVYLKNDNVGSVSLGLANQATDGISQANFGNVGYASTMGSLRPLIGPGTLDVLDLWDGNRGNLARYDSPILAGFQVSGSWGTGWDTSGDNDAGVWDVALRYAGEWDQFKVAAGVGYRDGVLLSSDDLGGLLNIGGGIADLQVLSGSVAVQHVPSGIFVQGMYGSLDASDWLPGLPDLKMWQAQAGIEAKVTKLGHTTLYGEYGETDFSLPTDPSLWGVGVIQAIDSAAMHIYVSGRRYKTGTLGGSEDLDVFMAGASIQF